MVAEFRADDPLPAPAFERHADPPLTFAVAVLFGGVHKVDAEVTALPDQVDAKIATQFGVSVGLAVQQQWPAKLPRAYANLRNLQPGFPQLAIFHGPDFYQLTEQR